MEVFWSSCSTLSYIGDVYERRVATCQDRVYRATGRRNKGIEKKKQHNKNKNEKKNGKKYGKSSVAAASDHFVFMFYFFMQSS